MRARGARPPHGPADGNARADGRHEAERADVHRPPGNAAAVFITAHRCERVEAVHALGALAQTRPVGVACPVARAPLRGFLDTPGTSEARV
eukprot:scaffold3254_cov273-Prasinococcus_capsulatus_cf.AAC.2